MIYKTCEQCGKDFSTRDNRKKFCNSSCSAKYNNSGVNRWANVFRNCKNCNADISSRKDKRDKYCSVECSKEYAHKTSKYYGIPFNECKICDNKVNKRGNKYCSKSCASKANSLRRYGSFDKTKIEEKICLNCNKNFTPVHYKTSYCSFSCQYEKKRQEKIDAWIKDPNTATVKGRGLSATIRMHLIEQANFTCTVDGCGWNQVNPFSGNTTLEVEHIDGDCMNNHPDNLTVLCPNHHSLTPTYRALNKGKSTRNRK